MELRHLRYFVAVAQTHNFTRAAEMLNISQPPLSQQILRLEREIGTPLLKRLTRSVELTPAGEAFYHDACQILELSSHALEKAKGIARGVCGQMSLGFASSVAFHASVFTLLRDFQVRYPEMELLTREENMAALMQDLQDGLLDAAFVRLPCESSNAFNLKVIATEKMLAALPAGHKLGAQPSLSLAQLANEQLIMFPREVTPSLYELVLSACLRAGFSPHRGQQSPQISSSLSMVAAGFGFAIVPESLCCISHPGVTLHQINDAVLHSDIALAWQRLERSPAVMHLVAMLKNPAG
ncbi:LysR family transcriptional regulator [Erwinia psidii]|uniref:LysR family transcriptional regulator n=1 Tax=Erwinia psidii TaxID=69224 RepID=A0A3N6US23_9GAMM|nr:LysR family transcriptional regulator [Erwinia psidii]MCX8958470.1 LysR family transcriptional regulator [Erwinia psidii]MCX8961020.1 LysR family transcriptional regulator [Erwinia psidii]MCX8965552.1 LysR family transcriptional regulator [Erwinia psidii]RQM38819.1 LysR family transcriptional regulator [Erwinia psidii]